jgi:hypothetical protein
VSIIHAHNPSPLSTFTECEKLHDTSLKQLLRPFTTKYQNLTLTLIHENYPSKMPFRKRTSSLPLAISKLTQTNTGSSSPSRSFFSPLLDYFRAPPEEIYYLDDAGLEKIERAWIGRREKRKDEVWEGDLVDGLTFRCDWSKDENWG